MCLFPWHIPTRTKTWHNGLRGHWGRGLSNRWEASSLNSQPWSFLDSWNHTLISPGLIQFQVLSGLVSAWDKLQTSLQSVDSDEICRHNPIRNKRSLSGATRWPQSKPASVCVCVGMHPEQSVTYSLGISEHYSGWWFNIPVRFLACTAVTSGNINTTAAF